jgi:hypothetical protein
VRPIQPEKWVRREGIEPEPADFVRVPCAG